MSGTQANYTSGTDRIQIRYFEAFSEAKSYYATLTHKTKGHPERLGPDLGRKCFGDEGYTQEEFVAELGCAFPAADLRIEPETRADHSAQNASWMEVLPNDSGPSSSQLHTRSGSPNTFKICSQKPPRPPNFGAGNPIADFARAGAD